MFLEMKFSALLLAAIANANPVPADTPAESTSGNTMDTDIIMINMNSANIQVIWSKDTDFA